MKEKKLHTVHRFLDEARDCTFYGKKRKSIIGITGVSNCFKLDKLLSRAMTLLPVTYPNK